HPLTRSASAARLPTKLLVTGRRYDCHRHGAPQSSDDRIRHRGGLQPQAAVVLSAQASSLLSRQHEDGAANSIGQHLGDFVLLAGGGANDTIALSYAPRQAIAPDRNSR